jgi:anti-anti-sigma factor
MTLTEQECGAVKVLRPEGPLKAGGAQQFKERLTELADSSLGRCVVDASAMQFVDSKGLEALAEANAHIVQTGHPLKLCGVNETVREVLDLTELSGQFEYFPDVNAAVRSFL